jgi:hypothetical protein
MTLTLPKYLGSPCVIERGDTVAFGNVSGRVTDILEGVITFSNKFGEYKAREADITVLAKGVEYGRS